MGKRKIKKGELTLEFEDDIELMRKKIIELEKLKKVILESSEYKILDGKTQMIGNIDTEEYPDGAHSRGEHTECVANIARDIVTGIYEKFGLEEERNTEIYQLNQKIAELYAEIMGYSHDLGHTPFGHIGESGLNEFMKSINSQQDLKKILKHRRMIFGKKYEESQGHNNSYKGTISFEHNEQSASVFYDILKRNKINTDLVDYRKIIWGILGHSVSRVDISILPEDISVRVIRVADKIEYINKDYEELKACLSKPKDVRIASFVKDDYKTRVQKCIKNLVDEAFDYGNIDGEMESLRILNDLKKISNRCVMFVDKYGKRGLPKDENVERLKLVTLKVAQYYYTHKCEELDKDISWRFQPLNNGKLSYKLKGYRSSIQYDETRTEKVIRFVSSMDNARCEQVYEKLVKDRILYGPKYGIEPITEAEIEEKKKQQLVDAANVLKAKFYRLSDDERIQKVKIESQHYIEEKLSNYGRLQLKKNKTRHAEENEKDFFAYKLMIIADGMRNIGKSQEEISLTVLEELKKHKEKAWIKEKYEIIPYDGKIAKVARGEFEENPEK